MTANGAGNKSPYFKKGEGLSAAKLNQVVQMIIQRIIGTPPVRVTSVAGGVAISIAGRRAGRSLSGDERRVFQIVTNVGGGAYTAQEFDEPSGTEIGEVVDNLYEANGSANVDVNWWVFIIFETEDYLYFDRPLGAC